MTAKKTAPMAIGYDKIVPMALEQMVNPDHEWFIFDESNLNLVCCKVCGIVKLQYGVNKPCRGRVKVGPRTQLT
jgi:hypothetical protein